MAACGLPVRNARHAHRCAALALDIKASLNGAPFLPGVVPPSGAGCSLAAGQRRGVGSRIGEKGGGLSLGTCC